MSQFPPIPQEVKPMAHLLKLADEHEGRNVVVTYWARMGACLLALRLVPNKKSPETAELIRALLDWLEQTKKENQDNEGITNETAAQALIEEYALKIFDHADSQDKAEIFDKNTVKLFYTAGMLMDVLEQFSKLDDDLMEKRKYAKWKAAYIHNCLKIGEKPLSGPQQPVKTEERKKTDEYTQGELMAMARQGFLHRNSFEIPAPDSTTPPDPVNTLNPSDPTQPADNGNFTHAPTSSPITPIYPSNPTPFNTPAPSQPEDPSPAPASIPTTSDIPTPTKISDGSEPTPEQIQKAQKFCKFATSALNYDDVKNAMDYLQKAMDLLNCKDDE